MVGEMMKRLTWLENHRPASQMKNGSFVETGPFLYLLCQRTFTPFPIYFPQNRRAHLLLTTLHSKIDFSYPTMNISKHNKRRSLFPQRQIDALGAERIAAIIRSDDILRVDSVGSLFGRSPCRSVHREHHRRRNRDCIAFLPQREVRIPSYDGSSVNSNVTSSLFSRQEILAQTQEERNSSLAYSRDNDDGAIDPSLSALLDEIMFDEI